VKVVPLQRAARKPRPKGRGIYRKRVDREAAKSLPCAWTIGDRKSFAAAKARAVFAICRDPHLSGRTKAILAACIDHMNPQIQFSCFAAMPSIAQEVGVNVATCWRAIGAAEGTYILTRRGKRYRDHGYTATEVTIHPRFGTAENTQATENYVANLRASSSDDENYIADLQKLHRNSAKTTSQICEHNPLELTLFKEPSLRTDIGFEENQRKEEDIRQRYIDLPLEFQQLKTRKKGNREERFLPKCSLLCRYFEQITRREVFVEADGQYTGRWFDSRELARDLGLDL
jgi:hypothetical protein